MLLTSGRPVKFKCVGATCIGETGHVREESLPPGIPFHSLDLERPLPLRVDGCVSLKGQKNTSCGISHGARALRERRLGGLSKRRILNENACEIARESVAFLPGSENALRDELFSSKKVDLVFSAYRFCAPSRIPRLRHARNAKVLYLRLLCSSEKNVFQREKIY